RMYRALLSFPTRRSSDLLSTIANIAISTLVSYLVVQIIPKKRVYTLTVWQQCIIILISCVTTFVLMSFSVDLPQHVKIDLRYNVDRKSTRLNSSHVSTSY